MSQHRLLSRRFAAAFAAAGFVFATNAVGAAGLPVYTVVAKNGRLTPSTLNVPAGVRFKIVVRNEGDGPMEFESRQLRKEKVLAPGAQSFVVVAPLKPGQYDFFDEFHPDTSKGRIVAR